MDTSEYKDVFAAEARDYLQSLNNDLLALEKNQDDLSVLDDMFRAAHSLKGMAGTMGYTELAEYTHKMESVFDLLRTSKLKATQEISNILFRTVDTLESILEQTLLEQTVTDPRQIGLVLEQLINGDIDLSDSSSESPAPASHNSFNELQNLELDEFDLEAIEQGKFQGYNAYEVVTVLRPKTLLKSVRVYTVFQALENYGTIIKSVPSAQELEDERFDLEFTVLYLSHENQGNIKSLVEGISEIAAVHITPVTDADVQPVQAHITESLETATNEVAVTSEAIIETAKPNIEQSEKVPQAAVKEPKTFTKAEVQETVTKTDEAQPVNQHRGIFADKYVRVETERLDSLINLVGELVISRTQVLELSGTNVSETAKNAAIQLDRITTEIQYASMKLRMVPIKQVFDRFPRMVRDLAQSRSKNILFEITGEETELDRSLVNNISDPIVHLIRNSVDHGIEPEEERIKLGKPAQGKLSLEARHEGSHVVIEIADDGRGINKDKIKEKAIRRGLLSDDYDAEFSISDAIEILFESGFSTSDEVTDVSGRGVGMDAVRSAVESLSGQVIMKSTPGQGTTTTIKLPLTLAIIKALLVECQNQTYAIPIQTVRENLLISKSDIKTVSQHDVIILRDEVLPILDLAETLGFKRSEHGDIFSVIVIESQDEKIGLIVDDLIGQQEIVIKSLADILGDINGIGGATILGDGQVALILDQSTLIEGRSESIGKNSINN